MLTCFAAGLVVLSPLLGRSETAPGHQRRLMLLAMLILDAITGIWMLMQYAYEVWGYLGFVRGSVLSQGLDVEPLHTVQRLPA